FVEFRVSKEKRKEIFEREGRVLEDTLQLEFDPITLSQIDRKLLLDFGELHQDRIKISNPSYPFYISTLNASTIEELIDEIKRVLSSHEEKKKQEKIEHEAREAKRLQRDK